MAKRKIINLADTDVYPVTHETCVFSSDGVAIPYKYLMKDALSTDIDSRMENVDSLNDKLLSIDSRTSDMSSMLRDCVSFANEVKTNSTTIVNQFIELLQSKGSEGFDLDSLLVSTLNYGILDKTLFHHLIMMKYDLPVPLTSSGCILIGDNFYIFGGFNQTSSSTSNKYFKYSISNDVISELSTTPGYRYEFNPVFLNDEIYTICGYHKDYLNSNFSFNVTTETWSTRASCPIQSSGAVATSLKNHIYLFGGTGSTNCFYDPTTNVWTTLLSTARNMTYSASVVYNDLIYVFYGNSSSSVECYDYLTDTWSTKASCPIAHTYKSATLIDDTAYVFTSSTTTGYSYHIPSNTWKALPNTLDSAIINSQACVCAYNEKALLIQDKCSIYFYMFNV